MRMKSWNNHCDYAKDLKGSNDLVGAEDDDAQKDNERDEEDWLQLHVSQKIKQLSW